MDRSVHAWIALRAIALLEDSRGHADLVELLKLRCREASVGAWIPDMADAKRGGAGSRTENHVLKFEPYAGASPERFIARKGVLLARLGLSPAVRGFLASTDRLDAPWWDSSYRGDVPRPGQHIPNRVMAMCTMLKDILLLGDEELDRILPGTVAFADDMDPECRTSREAAAMYFFMLSHFVADASMPCHCDARKLSAYSNGLHKELERHWKNGLGAGFGSVCARVGADTEDEALREERCAALLDEARGVDGRFDIRFGAGSSLPELAAGRDPWLEMIDVCRASFALASILAPYGEFPYGDDEARFRFSSLEKGEAGLSLEELDRIVLHDAVLNTAALWNHVWEKVSKE
jgi:hypothetical protein